MSLASLPPGVTLAKMSELSGLDASVLKAVLNEVNCEVYRYTFRYEKGVFQFSSVMTEAEWAQRVVTDGLRGNPVVLVKREGPFVKDGDRLVPAGDHAMAA